MEKTHDEEMAIDLWELISALKKRALIILAACLLGGVVGYCQVIVGNFLSDLSFCSKSPFSGF